MPRIGSFYDFVEQTFLDKIPGDIVECGVWRGGMMMLAAKVAQFHGQDSRHIWLYDTYTGMTRPDSMDVGFNGEAALEKWEQKTEGDVTDWCLSPLEEVERNMRSTGYSQDLLHFVKGDVLETLPRSKPEQIAILRLDTDWYASTKAELEHLYPRLSPGGFLIIADFSDWQGARKATEEFFKSDNTIDGGLIDGTFVGQKPHGSGSQPVP